MTWKTMESAPRDGSSVLAYCPEGYEIVEWMEFEADQPDQPGHNAGWFGILAWPGRSWGSDNYTSDPQNQPLRWQPLIEPEIDWDEIDWDAGNDKEGKE